MTQIASLIVTKVVSCYALVNEMDRHTGAMISDPSAN